MIINYSHFVRAAPEAELSPYRNKSHTSSSNQAPPARRNSVKCSRHSSTQQEPLQVPSPQRPKSSGCNLQSIQPTVSINNLLERTSYLIRRRSSITEKPVKKEFEVVNVHHTNNVLLSSFRNSILPVHLYRKMD